jgi:hypothetical protein
VPLNAPPTSTSRDHDLEPELEMNLDHS